MHDLHTDLFFDAFFHHQSLSLYVELISFYRLQKQKFDNSSNYECQSLSHVSLFHSAVLLCFFFVLLSF